jgi:FkbM family methyltransferase
MDETAEALRRWHDVRGDKTLRLEYDLNGDSIVFDVGGYEGQWASDIHAMYGCRVHIFEPVPEFANRIKKRFTRNPRILTHNFGLSSQTMVARLAVCGDGSSVHRQGTDMRDIRLVCAREFMAEEGIAHIDLMKINIEGGEYEVLQHLIDTGLIERITNVQVQFHDCVQFARARRANLQRQLEHTHELTYDFSFVWESWRLKTSDEVKPSEKTIAESLSQVA